MLYNEEFGIIVNRALEYAPLNAEYKHTWYCPASEDVLRKLGYKKIMDTPKPEDGYEYVMTWKETNKEIIKVWTKLPEPAPAQKRAKAYQTEKICEYGNELFTVDEMNSLWCEYSAEGNKNKVKQIKDIIVAAKAQIREKYPDKD